MPGGNDSGPCPQENRPRGLDGLGHLRVGGADAGQGDRAPPLPGAYLEDRRSLAQVVRQGGRPGWLKLAWDYLRTPRFNPLDLTTDNTSVLAFNLSWIRAPRTTMRMFCDRTPSIIRIRYRFSVRLAR